MIWIDMEWAKRNNNKAYCRRRRVGYQANGLYRTARYDRIEGRIISHGVQEMGRSCETALLNAYASRLIK